MPDHQLRTNYQVAADEIAAAAGITADTGTSYQLVDRYGVTYRGTPSHLAINALIRPDLTPGLFPDDNVLQAAVRSAAHRLGVWFTCPHTDPDHAAAFAALPPQRVCVLIAHLANHGCADALEQVGPASLSAYTAYLTSNAVDDPEISLPTLADNSYQTLSRSVWDDGLLLDVRPTTADGADTVAVRMSIDAGETISWTFVTDAPVPVAQLNDLIREPRIAGMTVGGWLEDNRALIDEHLSYDASSSDTGVDVTAHVVEGTTGLRPPTPGSSHVN